MVTNSICVIATKVKLESGISHYFCLGKLIFAGENDYLRQQVIAIYALCRHKLDINQEISYCHLRPQFPHLYPYVLGRSNSKIINTVT